MFKNSRGLMGLVLVWDYHVVVLVWDYLVVVVHDYLVVVLV